MLNDPRLLKQVQSHPYPLLFATISGAHLYGFPSPDSDFDLRGVHLLPLAEVVGLKESQETVEKSGIHDGLGSVDDSTGFDEAQDNLNRAQKYIGQFVVSSSDRSKLLHFVE